MKQKKPLFLKNKKLNDRRTMKNLVKLRNEVKKSLLESKKGSIHVMMTIQKSHLKTFLHSFAQCVFQVAESYIRTERIPKDDVYLILKKVGPFFSTMIYLQRFTKFKTSTIPSKKGSQTRNDLSDLQLENDDKSMKTKMNIGVRSTLLFWGKSFFKILLGPIPYWDCTHKEWIQ